MSSFFDKTMAMVDGVAVPYDATTDRKRRLSDAESGEPRGAPHKLRINRDECPLDDEDSDVDISIRRILSKASPVPDFANPLGYVDGDKLARELSFDDITDKTEIDKDASEGGEEVHENKHLPKSVWIE